MIDILPGILEKDMNEIERKLKVVAPYVPWVHLDMADNTYVPNTLVTDLDKLGKILAQNFAQKLSLEVHLMVAEPVKYIKTLTDIGVKRLTAHVEISDPRVFLDAAKYESVEAGLAIDGPTELEQIEPFLEEIDYVHVLTIEAGFSGQPFMPEVVEKIRLIRENYPDLPISVDGGMNDRTAKVVRDAGASRIIATSYFWEHESDITGTLKLLRGSD